jgi:hypothetical protein
MLEDDEDGLGGFSPHTLPEILEHCIWPTATTGMEHVGVLIIWCLVFRITTQTGESPRQFM